MGANGQSYTGQSIRVETKSVL